MTVFKNRVYEKTLAGFALASAVGLAFTALLISDDNDIAAGVCLVIAQFCTLSATLLGLDYKFNARKDVTTGNPQ